MNTGGGNRDVHTIVELYMMFALSVFELHRFRDSTTKWSKVPCLCNGTTIGWKCSAHVIFDKVHNLASLSEIDEENVIL